MFQKKKRDPVKVISLLRSLARNTATLVEVSTLEKDIRQTDNSGISRTTIYDYLDALNRLMIVEDQPNKTSKIAQHHYRHRSKLY